MNRFYRLGQELARKKFSSERVMVTNDQTYQKPHDPLYAQPEPPQNTWLATRDPKTIPVDATSWR